MFGTCAKLNIRDDIKAKFSDFSSLKACLVAAWHVEVRVILKHPWLPFEWNYVPAVQGRKYNKFYYIITWYLLIMEATQYLVSTDVQDCDLSTWMLSFVRILLSLLINPALRHESTDKHSLLLHLRRTSACPQMPHVFISVPHIPFRPLCMYALVDQLHLVRFLYYSPNMHCSFHPYWINSIQDLVLSVDTHHLTISSQY